MFPIKVCSGSISWEFDNRIYVHVVKGQLISKTNYQAEGTPKKWMNEFVFTSMRRVFVRFLGKSLAWLVCFRN